MFEETKKNIREKIKTFLLILSCTTVIQSQLELKHPT